ncbi:odorant receptor 30a-like [Anastrepha ludens]|uniref:odorant receptor 30a-like n=1 Tax=Anastrepha ludens TaxID=28586 RepID=UPI0023AF48EB|nr:odorant receptor 30a-like [Anastrepha ludens]
MHNYQNLQLYSVNVKIFLKFGFIGSASKMKMSLMALVPFITEIGQLFNLFVTLDKDISETGLNFFFLGVVTSGIIRQFIITALKDEKYVRLLRWAECWYHELERSGNPQILGKLQDITKRAQTLTRIGFYAACIGMVGAFSFPFSFEERKFVVDVSYPFFDVKQTPFYEFFFLLQALVLVPTFCCVYLPFTNLLITFLMFGEVVLLDLRLKLNNINKNDETVMLRELKECIAYHKKIIEFRNDVEDLVALVNFFDVALFGLMFCMMLFFISMVDDLQSILTALIFIGFTFYTIAISYYHANKFTNESFEICYAAYNTPWYNGNLQMRKCVAIMIARSQKPLQITAGGLYPMTLETFQAIVRISYSYFSLLQGLNQ